MILSPLLDKLIESLRCLPGVGPKSAQRMAFHLLQRNRQRGLHLADVLQDAMTQIQHCQQCHNFSEEPICRLCANPKRDHQTLCIVQSPADVLAIEQTASYQGRYFVLRGHLSPLDGIGPEDIGIEQLLAHLESHPCKEAILATSTTVEGEATAHYIAQLLQPLQIKTSRIAHGVPMGGELEYIDGTTLSRALQGREEFS